MLQFGESPGQEDFAEEFMLSMTYFTQHSLGGGPALKDVYDWRSSRCVATRTCSSCKQLRAFATVAVDAGAHALTSRISASSFSLVSFSLFTGPGCLRHRLAPPSSPPRDLRGRVLLLRVQGSGFSLWQHCVVHPVHVTVVHVAGGGPRRPINASGCVAHPGT
jgi:hypothetical protein